MIASLLNVVRPTPRKPQPRPASKPPLPEKLLADLVGLEASRRRRLDDRRRRPRLNHGDAVSIVARLPSGPSPLGTSVRDMSCEGIAIDAPMALSAGTTFDATVARVRGEGTVTLTYAVRRCEPQPDGRFLVGGELLEYRA